MLYFAPEHNHLSNEDTGGTSPTTKAPSNE
jgi:hypothetical protein